MQISIICLLTVFSCLGYAYESFFEDYKWLLTATADVYIFYLGSPAFVYLLLNKSIRNEAVRLLRCLTCNRQIFSASVAPMAGQTHFSTATRPAAKGGRESTLGDSSCSTQKKY